LPNKTYIYFIIAVLLVLLLTQCKFEEEQEDKEEDIVYTEKTPPKKLKIISTKGVYFIEQNWVTQKPDSLLKTNPDFYLLPNAELEYFLFITQNNDSIELSIRNISIKNPVIVFNEDDGPIICSYTKLEKYYKIEKPQINEELIEKIVAIIKAPITQPKKVHPYVNIRYFKTLDVTYLNYISDRTLKKKSTSDISQAYPIIPDKRSLEIQFDNDFWDYTDIYYTNGIRLGYKHPVFSNTPLSYILVSNGKNGIDYYGLQIIQNMYTGTKPKVDSIIPGDRPWASYSIIGQYAHSFDWEQKIKHKSEINIGLLGPKSGGGFLQNLVHTILPNNSPPQGWDHQIKTDLIIDYQYQITKSLYELQNFESYIKGSVQAGSLRDNVKWGFGAKWGKFTPFYLDDQHQVYQESNRKINYSLFGDIETQLIGYDATLQGGVTDRTSIYVIPTRDMQRFVIQGYLGAEISYKKIHLQFIQYWKSKEFRTGKDHKYVSVRLFIGI
jgi:hypothetical protein